MMYRNTKPLTSGFVRKLGAHFHCNICKCCIQGPPNDTIHSDHDHSHIEEMKPEDLENFQDAIMHLIDDTLETEQKHTDLEYVQDSMMEIIDGVVNKEQKDLVNVQDALLHHADDTLKREHTHSHAKKHSDSHAKKHSCSHAKKHSHAHGHRHGNETKNQNLVVVNDGDHTFIQPRETMSNDASL